MVTGPKDVFRELGWLGGSSKAEEMDIIFTKGRVWGDSMGQTLIEAKTPRDQAAEQTISL